MSDDILLNRILIGIIAVFIFIIVMRFKVIKPGTIIRAGRISDLESMIKQLSIDFAPNANITTDSDGNILAWNRASEIMFGFKVEEVIGKCIDIILPERYHKQFKEGLNELRLTGDSKVLNKTVELEALRRMDMSMSTKEFPIELTVWKWSHRNKEYYTGIVRNITKEKLIEAKHVAEIQLYKIGEEVDLSGVWNWDLIKDIVSTTPGFKRIFNVGPLDAASEYLLKRVHYEDRPKVDAVIKKAFETGTGYEINYRIIGTHGAITWINNKAKAYYNDNGSMVSIIGVIHEMEEAPEIE